jgi:chaperonin GroES
MMTPKTTHLPKIKTDIGDFDVVAWNGVNQSWIEPEADFVLVLPDQCETQSAGGILLPEDVQERITAAAETGVIVAVGPEAWKWNTDRSRRRESAVPAVGTRIYFARYSGQIQHGRDGRTYRLMEDKVIAGVERAPAAEPIPVKS